MQLSHRVHGRCACAGGTFALAGTERKYELSRPFVTTHLALDLELDFEKKSVEGTARLTFERRSPLDDELRLDAVAFDLRAVRLATDEEGKALESVDFTYDGDAIVIAVPKEAQRATVEVDYRAVPRLGLYFLAPDDKVKDRPRQVWSQCQDEDARHWIPCQDKPHVKMTTEMRVTVPHGMTALSNGELTDSRTPKGAKHPWVFHYSMNEPHPAYLITLVVGEFTTLKDEARLPSGRTVPLTYLVPPGLEDQGKRAFVGTPRMIEFFSKLVGVDYPFAHYAQVVVSDFIFGGMENTTATTMYEHILLDERAALDIESDDLVAHELAHQWFGDLVTCRDWSHAWLNEGFATFFEHLDREHRLGRDEYEWSVAGDLDTYLGEANSDYKRPIVCRDYEEPIDLFDRHLYEKGGLVLHMLRMELGDEVFWKAVRNYLESNRHGIVETNDLVRALEKASGRSLERFFDQWVFRPGHPVLDVSVSYDDGLLTVDLQQKQKGDDVATFQFPFEIEVSVSGKRTRYKRTVREKHEAIAVELAKRPDWVAFDPDFRVTAPVTLHAPSDMLRGQLRDAPKARLRALAAQALGKRHDPPVIDALAHCLAEHDEAWMVRAEAARALGKIAGDDAFAALSKACKLQHPKVRRAVAQALSHFKTKDAVRLLEKLAQDPSYLVAAAAARSLGKTRDKRAYDPLVALLEIDSWAEVIRSGALDGLSRLGDERAVNLLIERTKYGHPLRARRAALAALPKLAEGKKVRQHLEGLLDDPDPHLRVSVVGALESLGDTKAQPALRELLERELDGRVIRATKEALSNLGGESKGDLKKLRQETEHLRDELGKLRTRLSKLEQHEEVDSETKASEIGGKVPPKSKRKTADVTAKRATERKTPEKASAKKPSKKATVEKTPTKKASTKKATVEKTPTKKATAAKTRKR